jgi:hypothetical protein
VIGPRLYLNFQKDGIMMVYANVNLVPIKLASALMEEVRDDEFSLEIAIQDFKLACTYLGRVVACLDHLATHEIENIPVKKMSQVGSRLLNAIYARLSELQGRMRKPGS